jgi:hypothetical protein
LTLRRIELDGTQNYAEPLSEDWLLAWQAALFPTGRSGMRKIIVGAWRDDSHGPTQVISGPVGKEKMQYEAPAASLLEKEIPHPSPGPMTGGTGRTWCCAPHSPISGL